MSELFSIRYGLRPTPEGLMFEDVPERARIGLCHITFNLFGLPSSRHQQYLYLYQVICTGLRIPRIRTLLLDPEAYEAIENIITNCEWWQFYDICEVITNYMGSIEEKRVKLAQQFNTLFQEEWLGFEFRDDKIEKRGSAFIDAQIKEARYLLKDSEFKGADEHFEKSIRAINKRPKPDVENCIKDAVAAIESVGRIIVKDEKALLSTIIKDMVAKGIIPKLLGKTIQTVYAYRGDEPGVAHGLVGDSKVTDKEAEFVVALAAAIIIYLVDKNRSN